MFLADIPSPLSHLEGDREFATRRWREVESGFVVGCPMLPGFGFVNSNSWSRFEKTPFNTRHKVACPFGRRERHHSEGIKSSNPRPSAAWRFLRRAYASDHQFLGDAAHIDFEIEALHRQAREMPGQTARDGSATNELVGKERMDVKDRINLGSGHIRPAEAQRRHPLCRGAGVCAGRPRGERTGAVGDIGVDARDRKFANSPLEGAEIRTLGPREGTYAH